MEKELSTAIGEQLRTLRGAAGLTQRELGRRLGVTSLHAQNYISRIESGARGPPTLSLVIRYIQACGGRVSEFFAQLEQADKSRPEASVA